MQERKPILCELFKRLNSVAGLMQIITIHNESKHSEIIEKRKRLIYNLIEHMLE